MKKRGALDNYVRSPDEEFAFVEEKAMAQIALALSDLLVTTNTTQRILAERIGVSEARISQILSADSNPTVKTIARLGHAMGHRMMIDFRSSHECLEEATPWPTRLRLVPPQWEPSNDKIEETNDSGIAA